jgi:hypothetical protein
MDFVIEHSRVMNRDPQNGEPQTCNERWSEDGATLIEGHTGRGRICHAARLVANLKGKDGRLPKYFQVVVKAQFKSQVPIRVEQVTARVLGN